MDQVVLSSVGIAVLDNLVDGLRHTHAGDLRLTAQLRDQHSLLLQPFLELAHGQLKQLSE